MLRREIVLLVSRAVALLLAVPAIIGFILSVPTQMYTAYLRESMRSSILAAGGAGFLTLQGIALAAGLLGLAIHLAAAALFWKCGPAVERMLLPASEETA